MKKILNLGFIGGGLNSAVGRTHFIASQMDQKFQVVSGVFSRNKKINLATGALWNVNKKRIYHDIDEYILSEKNSVDAVAVLSPSTDHFHVLEKLIKNKIPVICEKSFTKNEKEARKICQLIKKHKSYVSLVYNYTGYPMVRELRDMIRSGAFGKIVNIIINMPQEGFMTVDKKSLPYKPQSWRLTDGEIPTISLDLGIHLFHMLRFLVKEKPLYATSIESNYGNFRNLIDDVKCLVKLENKITASMWFSKSALGNKNGLSIGIYGVKGACLWKQETADKIEVSFKNGEKKIIERGSNSYQHSSINRYSRFKSGHPTGFIEAFANMYWDIADDIQLFLKNGKKRNSKFVFYEEHGLEGLSFLKKISSSSKKGIWIKL